MPTLFSLDPDVQLMLRVQRDEPGAFAELLAAYWLRIFGKFVRQMGDRQEAEDLAQDVFLRLYRNRKRYRPRANLATWIFFIARNVARNAIRRRRRKRLISIGIPSDSENFIPRVTNASSLGCRRLEQAELSGRVRAAVAALNRRQRRAVELQFENRSYTEIASDLAMSPKAAKSLLYR